ncbi:MAG: hypothetical protein CL940_10315 [Deltaproteobacteria bacterium]|nr:hypothetical protein [Deltaproteobacteria bacterium]
MRTDVLVINVNLNPATTEGCEAIQARLQMLRPELSVAVMHWTDASLEKEAENARGLVLGPNENPFPSYPDSFRGLLDWVRVQGGPILGVCGGHQVLALAHGAHVAPVHDVPPATTSYAGMPKMDGLTPTRRVREDPLCADLPERFEVSSSHVDEVKSLPEGFRLILEGAPSVIQMMRMEGRPVWGVQFHPEHDRAGDAGRGLLERWLDLL